MTPEGALKKQYRAWLRSIGAFCFSPTPVGYGQPGLDDFVCYRGRFFAVEAKRGDTRPKPTARQYATLEAVRDAGGWTVVAYSLEDVQEVIRQIDRAIGRDK